MGQMQDINQPSSHPEWLENLCRDYNHQRKPNIDEQRIQAYLQLIFSLLNCPNGQEMELLEANSDLVDGGLLEWIALVAADLAEKGNQNAADWLLNFASQLAEALGISSPSATPEEYLAFLQELLDTEYKSNGNPQAVYQVLQRHLNKLDTHFAQILKQVATAWISQHPEDAESIVVLIENISNLIQEFPLGNIANNLEIAIAGYAVVLQKREVNTEMWAQVQNNLGSAYRGRIKEDKADNIELAIAAFHNALQVYTPQAFPQHWAATQNNLGTAYWGRIKGDKADNIELAIAAYTQALQVYTPQAFPQQWVITQNNLGLAYCGRIKGDKASNIELGIKAHTQALQVDTAQAFLQDWAMNQNNLGNAYCERIKGDKADNIELAIAAYTEALQMYTPQASPQDWAATQNNLGTAYSDRIKGDKADNIELAIKAYTQALEVRTIQAFPQDWAMTQNNLGTAYWSRIKGDKADNIELAIGHYQDALQVRTPNAFPIECLQTSRNLGDLAFEIKNWQLASENYEKAIASVERSRNWATTDKRRHEILKDAIKVYEKMVQACINNDRLDKALEYSERSRSKTMGDIMASNRYFEQGEIDLKLKQAWHQVDPLNLSQIQGLIDNDKTALLSFYTTENDTHVFILLKDRLPQLFTCKGQGLKALQSWLWDNWLIPYVEFRDAENWEWKDKMGSVLAELSRRLQVNELIAKYLNGIEELIIVPHLMLHQIPFAALPVAVGGMGWGEVEPPGMGSQ
ncbi:MAG TPA: hypothetical protein DCZ55_36315, partial [Cyanobacteria bacterium UBA11371]|nr:hypothetical protein [Cyanobacteria bacterium UBA11371]